MTRVLGGLIGLLVIALFGYTVYVGAAGSQELTDPIPRDLCATPDVQFGWAYEAINYDQADDARLMATSADRIHCPDQGAGAGSEVVTADGVPIAGWYIPAADGVGPTGPTIILVHGWNANKSEVLRYAVPLHERFNIVAIDLRHGGRSGDAPITFGVRERLDVGAVIDWLERTKRPVAIGLMGNSMGGATAAATALDDQRVRAIVLDSTHAAALELLGTQLAAEEGHPPFPGSLAMIVGIWVRTGIDVRVVDPIETVPRLTDRPVLLLHGSRDVIDVPDASAERVFAAARDAGVDIDLRYCEGGGHGTVIDTCPAEWGAWAVDFFTRALDP